MAAGKQVRTAALQRKRRSEPAPSQDVHALAGSAIEGPGESLPFLDVISASFGAHDVSGVQAHTDDRAAAAAAGMGATAFATGDHVAFGAAPDLHTAAHEAAHVVQQRAGVQLKGGVGEAGDPYEQHADAVADAVVRGESAESLLDAHRGRGHGGGGGDAVQRRVTVTTGLPSHTEPDAAVLAMTISRFVAYTREQADWSTHVTAPEKPQLQQLLHDLLATPALQAGLGSYTVSAVLAQPAGDWVPLRAYCAAVDDAAAVPTAKMEAAPSLARALQIGVALPRLETAVGDGMALYHITAPGDVNTLIQRGRLDELIRYCTAKSPQWQAPDGKELESFLKMKVNFFTSYPALADVRNLHHFDDPALKRLNDDMLGGHAGKPLALILHTGLDHSGAFHHDINLTAAITGNPNRVIMVEGKSSLAEIEGMLPTIAATYGGGQINQVMIAGHGDSRVIELAGTTASGLDAEGRPEITGNYDDLDLDGNNAATQAFFTTLMNNMGGADSRIVFNGCLTASNDVTIDPASPDSPEQQIANQLGTNASLVDTMRAMIAAQGGSTTVLGGNASFPEGPALIDGAGNFDIRWTDDPELTNVDRLQYIRHGIEPTGVLRAVLEHWKPPGGPTDWIDAVDDRLLRPTNTWDGAIITTALTAIKAAPADAQLVSDLAHAVDDVSEGYFTDDSKAERMATVPLALRPMLFGAVEGSTEWPGEDAVPPIGIYTVWGKTTATKLDALITHLTTAGFTTSKAAPYLDWRQLDDTALTRLLPAAARSAPTQGHLVIACANVQRSTRSRVAVEFLKAYAGANGNQFPAAPSIDAIADDSSSEGILGDIGLAGGGGGGGGGATVVEANVDSDKDGKNDRFVERTAGFGEVVNCDTLRVHAGPGNAAAEIGFLHAGDKVFVQGTRNGWCSIDFSGTTGYVWNRFLTIT